MIFGYLPRVTREAPPGDRLRTIRSALLHSGQMTDGATDVLDEGTGEFQGVPATGRPVRFAVMAVLRFADGQAVEHWGLVDFGDLMAQLTAAGAKPATAAT